MPIYEFECTNGHITETIVLSNYLSDHILCPHIEKETEAGTTRCSLPAYRIWSKPANIQIGKPTIVFENPQTGQTQIATFEHQETPRGFIKRELKGTFERSTFEKSEQRRLDATNEIVSHELEMSKEAARKARHNEINANMSSLAAESDNPSGAEHLIRSALNRPKRNKIKPRRSEGILAVNHMDQSNLKDVIK